MHIPTPNIELPFFTNLLILLVAARILGEICERFKQPAMIGEILAGIILGPSLFNIIHRTEEIKVISELGVFLLVIIAGLEIKIEDIIQSLKGRNFIISILAFFVPITFGLGVGYFFKMDVMASVFVALCIAITALPVSIRILMDLGKINTEVGKKIISAAIFDDVVALSVLGVLLNVKDTDHSWNAVVTAGMFSVVKLVIFIGLLTLMYILLKIATNKGNYLEESLNKLIAFLKGKEPLFAIFFAFVLLFSTITESLGLHFIIGAFFASLAISDKVVGKEHLKTIEKTTSNMSMGFLAPIFFAGIGLEFQASSVSNYGLLIVVVLVSFASKIIAGFAGGKIIGMNNRSSFALGIGLNARGIMGLVIADIAFKNGLISAELFSILVIMGVLTTISTALMMRKIFTKITD